MNFLRDYRLYAKVKGSSRAIEIKPPIRIAFDGLKNTGQGAAIGANSFNFTIYGLAKKNRDIFFKEPSLDLSKIVSVEFKVGYNGNLKTVFVGTVHRGAVKLGDQGHEVTINCFSGGAAYLGAYISKTVTTKKGAVDATIESMSKVDPTAKRGKIEEFFDLFRPKVLVGASSRVLQDSLNDDEEFFIDNGLIHVKKKNKVISGFIPLVNKESGLMTTPERDFFNVTFETVLNPQIALGGAFKLESSVTPQFNGVYQAIAINYKGDTEGSDWKQQVTGTIN